MSGPEARSASLALVIFTGSMLALSSGRVDAEAWRVNPYAKLTAEYDDNARLDPEEKEEVQTTIATGGLAITRETEVVSVAAEVRLDAINYDADSEDFEDDVNKLVRLDAVRRGERSRLGLTGAIEQDTLLRTVEAVVPDDIVTGPDEDVDPALVRLNIGRTTADISPSWLYRTGERSDLGLEYRYRAARYDEIVEDLADYSYQTLSAAWGVDTSEINRFTAALETSRFDSDEAGQDYDQHSFVAGFAHQFSEISEGRIEAGYNRLEEEDASNGGDDIWTVQLFASKSAGLTRYSGRIGHSIFPSGVGDLVTADEAVFKMVKDISPRSDFWISVKAFQSESVREDNRSANRRYLSVQPAISWYFTPEWSVEGSYRYRRQKRDTDRDSAESNLVYLALRYTFQERKQP